MQTHSCKISLNLSQVSQAFSAKRKKKKYKPVFFSSPQYFLG